MTVDVTVVSPLYRTATFARQLVDRLEWTFTQAGLSWSGVFVDDACPDASWRAVEHDAVEIIRLSQNRGQHGATTVGVAAATGSVIVVMDSDLQDRPEDIPALLAAMGDGHLVAAGRRGAYESIAARVAGGAFRAVRWLRTGGAIPIDAGMFVGGPADIMKRVAVCGDPGRHFLSGAGDCGIRIVTVPLTRDRRPSGRGSHSTRQRWRMAMDALAAAPRDGRRNGASDER